MKSIEKELKYQVSKDNFAKFKRFLTDNNFEKINSFIQINYYLDTKDLFFKERNITARIRKIMNPFNKYEFTLKIPLEQSNKINIKIKNEFSIDLNREVAENIISNNNLKDYYYLFNNIFEELEYKVDVKRISIIGELVTKRELYLISESYRPINLDSSLYIDEEDYEIEWEEDKIDEVEKLLLDIFECIDIEVSESCISKNTRFFNTYMKKCQNKLLY